MGQKSFSEELKEKAAFAEAVLKKYTPSPGGFAGRVLEAVEYSVSSGGKHLRPVIMKEVFDMYGGKGEVIEPFMAAIEFIHNYSLIHDDLPAMDNDMYRRGKKTTHAVYGEGIATLAGDCLLNLSFETAMKAFDLIPEETSEEERESLRSRIIDALRVLFDKSGMNGMLGGQSADVDAEKRGLEVDGDRLIYIHENKTAALIEAALVTGGILGGAKEEDREKLFKIGSDTGIAFQIKDDILDVTGDEAKLGKHVGSDSENGKVTYVTLYGLEKAEKDQRELSLSAVEKLDSLAGDSAFLRELISSLVDRES